MAADESPASETATLGAGASEVDTLAHGGAGERATPSFAPGGRIGRFHIFERVGAGAMGVVYAAYDPELDRRVAIKVLSTQHLGADRARGRLLREAQAMARLSHPNVVSVHDVGTVHDQVYLAIEFIEGTTLRQWLESESRPWQDVVTVFRAAGEGLAAAHAKDIVHGDFKPANVLVADDARRVLVTDFGLARAEQRTDSLSESSGDVESLNSGSSALSAELTRATTLLGTPAYMAPEQFRGEPSDARTDQFNFCVALWEALYGERPFDGEGSSLMLAVLDDRRRSTPTTVVPAWLRRAVDRGLATNPEQRWPSLQALLDELSRDPGRTRRRLLGATLFAAATLGVVGIYDWNATRAEAACIDAGAEIESVWSEQRRGELDRRIRESGAHDAIATADIVVRSVDEWATRWSERRSDMCRRARASTVAPDVVEASKLCFAQRAESLDATLEALVAMPAVEVPAAIPAVSQLPRTKACVDDKALQRGVDVVAADVPRDKRIQWERSLQRTRTLRLANRLEEALELARAVSSDPELPHSMRARATHQVGAALIWVDDFDGGRTALENAYFEALESDNRAVAFEAATDLAKLVQTRLVSEKEAWLWLRLAEASLDEDDPIASAELERARGVVHYIAGDPTSALESTRNALRKLERELGPDAMEVAETRRMMGVVLNQLERHQEALTYNQQVLDKFAGSLGPGHLRVARARNTLALSLEGVGEAERAEQEYERSLDGYEQGTTRNALARAMVETNLASLYVRQERFVDAELVARNAYRKRREGYGPSHAYTLKSLTLLVHALEGLDRRPEAVQLLNDNLESCRGPICTGRLHRDLGLLLANSHEATSAEYHLREAAQASGVLDDWERGQALVNLARLVHVRGDVDEATSLARDAAKALSEAKGRSREVSIEHEALGDLFAELGLRDEARKHLDAAIALIRKGGAVSSERMTEIDKKLAELETQP